jgi:hypothetical protein
VTCGVVNIRRITSQVYSIEVEKVKVFKNSGLKHGNVVPDTDTPFFFVLPFVLSNFTTKIKSYKVAVQKS